MGNRKNTKTIIWLEKTRFWEVFIFFLKGIFCDIKVKYDENNISPFARSFLISLEGLNLSKQFSPAYLTLDKKDSQGYALNYRMENNLDKCLDIFCDAHIPDKNESFKRMIKSFMASYLFYRVTFITMVAHKPEFCAHDCRNVLYLNKSPFNSTLINFYKEKGYLIRESFLSLLNFKYYLRPLYLLLKILIFKFSLKKTLHNFIDIKPSVWIEYAHQQKVDFSFWHEMINKSDFDIVYYLDRNDDLPIEAVAEIIERRGFKWIYLHFNSLIKLANFKLKEITELILTYCSIYPSYPSWFKVFKFEYKMWFLLFRNVFERFKVKVLIQHQEFFWVQQPQKEAVESAGGIMVGYHWSNFPYMREPFHLTPHHVYFVWGKAKEEWVRKKGTTSDYILPSGIWMTHHVTGEMKNVFFARRPEFVITLFDSSVRYNMYLSRDTLIVFFERMLGLLAKNSAWGGIIKNKFLDADGITRVYGSERFVKLMNELVREKRLVVVKPTVSPEIVSSYSDLSVCYSLNSAGVIAGIYGHRAVHWDSCGWLRHPFYQEKGQKIIYLDLDEIEEAIIRASKGEMGIGDFSRWRKDFNYFEDFHAAKRVGKFINSFMERAARRVDLSDILYSTVKEYILDNNIEESFFEPREWWGKE